MQTKVEGSMMLMLAMLLLNAQIGLAGSATWPTKLFLC
jgi:hypothetical protein